MMTETAWRVVHADFTSRNHTFKWPFPGGEIDLSTNATRGFSDGPCPTFEDDGVCLAKTWRGAASGGIPAHTGLIVEYEPENVLGEDEDKLRVSRCGVVDVIDLHWWLRLGWFARANLRGANLRGANLWAADLWGADLRGAGLWGADLRGADLWRANLRGADLRRADLRGAGLREADLRGADLRGADLRGADLRGANADDLTLWPEGFVVPEGVVFVHRSEKTSR